MSHVPDSRGGVTRVAIATADPVYAACLKSSLEARGMAVAVFDPGRGGASVTSLDLSGIDVLLVETWGVGESGWAVIERVRDESPMTEIVVVSSDPPVQSAVQALRNGVFAFHAYPVSDAQLVESIEAACRRKRYGDERIKALECSPIVPARRSPN